MRTMLPGWSHLMVVAFFFGTSFAGCLGGSSAEHGRGNPFFPPLTDQGENLTWLAIEHLVQDLDHSGQDDVLLRVFGRTRDDFAVPFAATVNVSLERVVAAPDGSPYFWLNDSWLLSIEPRHFDNYGPSGVHFLYFIHDRVFTRTGWYRAVVEANLTMTSATVSDVEEFFYAVR